MKRFAGSLTVVFCLWSGSVAHAQNGPIQVGYVIVTPSSSSATGLVVFETFGERKGNDSTQAGVLPAGMTNEAVMFVSTNGKLSRNLGVAIANPGSSDAAVTLKIKDEAGVELGTKTTTVGAGKQMALFVTEMFADVPSVPKDVTGTVVISSPVPVAVVGLRFRGSNFSTLPSTNLSAPTAVPTKGTGIGGAGSIILPHFATGGGWDSEIIINNTGTAAMTVRVDLFKQDGTALVANLNNESKSSWTGISIPAGGVFVLAPKQGGESPF